MVRENMQEVGVIKLDGDKWSTGGITKGPTKKKKEGKEYDLMRRPDVYVIRRCMNRHYLLKTCTIIRWCH